MTTSKPSPEALERAREMHASELHPEFCSLCHHQALAMQEYADEAVAAEIQRLTQTLPEAFKAGVAASRARSEPEGREHYLSAFESMGKGAETCNCGQPWPCEPEGRG